VTPPLLPSDDVRQRDGCVTPVACRRPPASWYVLPAVSVTALTVARVSFHPIATTFRLPPFAPPCTSAARSAPTPTAALPVELQQTLPCPCSASGGGGGAAACVVALATLPSIRSVQPHFVASTRYEYDVRRRSPCRCSSCRSAPAAPQTCCTPPPGSAPRGRPVTPGPVDAIQSRLSGCSRRRRRQTTGAPGGLTRRRSRRGYTRRSRVFRSVQPHSSPAPDTSTTRRRQHCRCSSCRSAPAARKRRAPDFPGSAPADSPSACCHCSALSSSGHLRARSAVACQTTEHRWHDWRRSRRGYTRRKPSIRSVQPRWVASTRTSNDVDVVSPLSSTSSDSVWLLSKRRAPGSLAALQLIAVGVTATARAAQLRFTCVLDAAVARQIRRRRGRRRWRGVLHSLPGTPPAASPSHPVTQVCRRAVAPTTVTCWSSTMSPFGRVIVRETYPAPALDVSVLTTFAPNSSHSRCQSSAHHCSTCARSARANAPVYRVAASTPLYSRIRTSGYTAPDENTTVTVFAPAAAATMFDA